MVHSGVYQGEQKTGPLLKVCTAVHDDVDKHSTPCTDKNIHILQMLTDFNNTSYLVYGIWRLSATQQLLIFPPHLNIAATLPWENMNPVLIPLTTDTLLLYKLKILSFSTKSTKALISQQEFTIASSLTHRGLKSLMPFS